MTFDLGLVAHRAKDGTKQAFVHVNILGQLSSE
jgi:hypothetical protein